MKEMFKSIAKSFSVLLISIVCGAILLGIVYSLPTNRIITNASKSKDLYYDNMIKSWNGNSRYGKLDTTTDAIMISNAVSRCYDSIIKNALLNGRYSYTDASKDDSNQESLYRYLNGEIPDENIEYARYWHGYLIWMIPGLYFFDTGGLRTIMMFVQFFLVVLVLNEFSKISKLLMINYCFIFCFMSPITTSMNFANANCNCLLLLSLVFILKFNAWLIKNNRFVYFFLISGILTMYFDFFTYPIVVWGIPLITFIAINKFSIKESFDIFIKTTIAWFFGYLGMWVGKCLIATLLTDVNVIKEATDRLLHWTIADSNNYSNVSFFDSFKRNIETFDNPMLALLISNVIVILIWIVRYFNNVKSNIKNRECVLLPVLLLVLIGLSTFVWYYVVRVPSYIHPWYHYRILAIFIWSITSSSYYLIDNNQKNTIINV